MTQARYVTIMVVPDGTEVRRQYRIKAWVGKAAIALTGILLVAMVIFTITYGRVAARAAAADRLQEENERLLRYQHKVRLLEQNLTEARDIVTRLASMAGIDFKFPDYPEDSAFFADLDTKPLATIDRSGDGDPSWPSGMPARGFISQDFEIASSDRYHPGIDIACAEGTPVLATASGTVVRADFDTTYGYTLVLRHNDSVTTVYGHNSQLLVEYDQRVMVGSRIALSGNTGKSTAPHLHYEIRINDQPIDPMGKPYDEETQYQ